MSLVPIPTKALENLDLKSDKPDTPKAQRDRSHWVTKLEDLNLEAEVLFHYNTAKDFLDDLDPTAVEPNKYAQAINSISAILKTLTSAQSELYSAERVKKLESALIKTLKTLPEDTQNTFFTLYQAELDKVV